MDFNNLDFVRWEAPATAPLEESGVPPLPTGIKDLDDRIGGGMHPGSVYRLSGRPTKGKTTCALNIARCAALGVDHDGQSMRDGHNRPHPVLLFSLELPMEQVVQRLLGGSRGTAGRETPTDVADLRVIAETLAMNTSDLARAPIFVYTAAPLDICDIAVRARDMKSRHGIELVIIDYLQLCACREYACLGRRAETSALLHGLRKLSEELHVPVLVLEQASRKAIPDSGHINPTDVEQEPRCGMMAHSSWLPPPDLLRPSPGKDETQSQSRDRAPASVTLHEIVEDEAWQHCIQTCRMPLALGKGAAGNTLVSDLAGAPHLLIAGEAGSGKTSFLHAIVNGFLMSRTPEQMRLILVDTRRETFFGYTHILPHMRFPIANSLHDVLFCLRWAVAEADMRRRYLDELRVGAIADLTPAILNGWATNLLQAIADGKAIHRKKRYPDWKIPLYLPDIVIVVDELSDIMQEFGKEVEDGLRKLASCGRDVGIHLILATQNRLLHGHDLVSKEFQTYIPCRIAFKMEYAVQSRTFLGTSGAEELRGKGDMLIRWHPDAPLIRAQSPWISANKRAIVSARWGYNSSGRLERVMPSTLRKDKV